MAIVNNLINDLVDEHEILPNALFIQDAAIVPENLHHTVDDIQDGGWSDVCLACRHEVNAELLREEIVNSIHMLNIYKRVIISKMFV